jgi:hypothetical protein
MINASEAALGSRSATISVPPTTVAVSVNSFWNDKSSVSNPFGRSHQRRDVRFWHLADNHGTATFCPLLE